VAGTTRLVELASDAEVTAANARFFAQPLPVVLHILAAVPYSILGALQFSAGFRRRLRGWHRAVGGVLAICGMVAALTGLWMAHFYAWPEADGEALYAMRLAFGSAMAASLVLAVDAIRRRDFAAHGAWMIRAYAIGLGAGTQVLTHLPWFILFGQPGELPRAVMMGAGWVINVIVAEWVIRRSSLQRRREPRDVVEHAARQPTPIPLLREQLVGLAQELLLDATQIGDHPGVVGHERDLEVERERAHVEVAGADDRDVVVDAHVLGV
jgi:uncharacterized membrane protein